MSEAPEKALPERAREEAAAIKPPEWEEGDKTFFYPTLDNHMRYGLHDLLIELAERIEELERERDEARAYIERRRGWVGSTAITPELRERIGRTLLRNRSQVNPDDYVNLLRDILAATEGKG